MNERLNKEVEKQLGFPYHYSAVNQKQIDAMSDSDLEDFVFKKLEHLRTIKSKPYYWIHNGHASSLEEAAVILKMKKPKPCPTCNKVYDKTTVSKPEKYDGCSLECQIENKRTFRERLSKSRNEYNVWDPSQYAERHGISIEEAEDVLEERKRVGTRRGKGYWLERGYTEEEAAAEISKLQSSCSPRTILYWTERGYSDEEAVTKVSEYQSENAVKLHQALKANGSVVYGGRQWQYYVNKGIAETEEEARVMVSDFSRKGSRSYWDNVDREEVKKSRPMHIEYWEHRYPDNAIEMYTQWRNERHQTPNFRSAIADEFCLALASFFPEDKLYHTEKEFGKYIPDVGYKRYDFVNLTKTFCVEFHGNYWHEEDCPKDAAKKAFMEDLGFSYFVVWESDYRDNKTQCVEALYNKIMEHYDTSK